MSRILFVDDDPGMRALLRMHLSRLPGCEPIEAAGGAEALALAGSAAPDLVLMDLSMPGMDGIEAIRELRKDPRMESVPILFLSAEQDRAKWVRAFEAGANDFIPKPCQRRELLARIRTHLRVASLTRELTRKNELLERDRQLARSVQLQLLPRSVDFEGLEAASLYLACAEIGGDYLDAWETDGKVCLVVGDIAGHGAPSALMMAVVKGILHSLTHTGRPPEEMVSETNRLLYRILAGGDLDMFVTLFFAVVDLEKDELRYHSAGHVPAYVLGPEGTRVLEATSPALGWHEELPWRMGTVPYLPGETLFLCTDGVMDVRRADGAFFEAGRLLDLLGRGGEPEDLIDRVRGAILEFGGGRLDDDLTMLAVRRQ